MHQKIETGRCVDRNWCANECVCVCVCVCVCARARAQVCRAQPKPRGLIRTATHRRAQTYLKIVTGKIQTHALLLHTLWMQILEMVKKHKRRRRSALGIIIFRREQGFVEWRGTANLKKPRGYHIVPCHYDSRSEGSPHNPGMRNKFRSPLVAVFTTYSFQNYGSLHLVKSAA